MIYAESRLSFDPILCIECIGYVRLPLERYASYIICAYIRRTASLCPSVPKWAPQSRICISRGSVALPDVGWLQRTCNTVVNAVTVSTERKCTLTSFILGLETASSVTGFVSFKSRSYENSLSPIELGLANRLKQSPDVRFMIGKVCLPIDGTTSTSASQRFPINHATDCAPFEHKPVAYLSQRRYQGQNIVHDKMHRRQKAG